jgi:hypothetical protein
VLGIDVDREAAIPDHTDVTLVVDLVDDPAVARTETQAVGHVVDELDPGSYRDAGLDTSGKKTSAEGIHERVYRPRTSAA